MYIMKLLLFLSLIFNFTACLFFNSHKIVTLDKSHLKNYANNWIDIWKNEPSPLSELRINECWKSIIWCTENKYKQYAYCLSYKRQNYFVFVCENESKKELKIIGILENPHNIYTSNQIDELYNQLLILALQNNYSLNIEPLRNWSHGYYLYEYNNI